MLKQIRKDEWYPFYYFSDYEDGKEFPDDLVKKYEKALQKMREVNDELGKIYEQQTS